MRLLKMVVHVAAIVGSLLFGTLTTAHAAPVDVTLTVSGSAGNWLLNFAVSDNLGGTNNLYLFGVVSSQRNIAASPAGWDPDALNGYNPAAYGGSNTNYNNLWITGPSGSTTILPGQTLSGFCVSSSDAAMPTNVPWMAVATGGVYMGPGCSFICGAPYTNPGFEGIAVPVVAAVGDAPLGVAAFALVGSNPARGAAEFHFAVPEAGHVVITVHDLSGRVVATLMDGQASAGRGSVIWRRNASDPAGVYFARMRIGGRTLVQRMILLK
jgi:hypothetical protein